MSRKYKLDIKTVYELLTQYNSLVELSKPKMLVEDDNEEDTEPKQEGNSYLISFIL
jgi:hypothetical protein